MLLRIDSLTADFEVDRFDSVRCRSRAVPEQFQDSGGRKGKGGSGEGSFQSQCETISVSVPFQCSFSAVSP